MKAYLINAYLKGNKAMRTWLRASETISATDEQALQILQHSHVASLETEYRGSFDQTRCYLVTTPEGHRYTVRFHDQIENSAGETSRFGKCNCQAGTKNDLCRHLIKAAAVDSEKFNRPLETFAFSGYKGHLTADRKADQKTGLQSLKIAA